MSEFIASAAYHELDGVKYEDEAEAVRRLLASQSLNAYERIAIVGDAEGLVVAARRAAKRQGVVESFLQEFSLGTREGLALMCLAEALLRTPDEEARDRLIAEKIGTADWASHLGHSDSLFVNASTWGLMLTGRLIEVDERARQNLPDFIKQMSLRLGEPVIRQAVAAAVRIMGEQFVLGRDIKAALNRAKKDGFLCSFDMLGEGARTDADAQTYTEAYAKAIEQVGAARGGEGPESGHGVSVKLSALYPRYEATRTEDVFAVLYPRLLRLAELGAKYDLNLTLDAEEADRLVLSLQLLDRLAREPSLGAWRGLGLAVQAYQKRAPQVIAAVAKLARDSGRRLMVRLVKGAYWDSEIKRAQVAGRPDYPVYTTKAATDVSYLVCAKAMIDAAPAIYGQFATHNAHSLCAVRSMAQAAGVKVEFQRLHGMGEGLYRAAQAQLGGLTLRAYAPVGGHEDLLPYLVRRLLENGANTSFVHALLDERIGADEVVADPIRRLESLPDRHAKIPPPPALYGDRINPQGLDLSQQAERLRVAQALRACDLERRVAGPILGGQLQVRGDGAAVRSPSGAGLVLGQVYEASAADIDAALQRAHGAQKAWDGLSGLGRAAVLTAMGDALEAHIEPLCALLVREAGKTWNDAVSEVREAADFCRYYARLAARQFAPLTALKGPVGEVNSYRLKGRGVFVSISPWNFPLAIFTGQLAAALAAGNAVLAKPAEQTPLIAAEAVRLFHAAGLNPDLLALLPGRGETVGAALVGHPNIDGVTFTGGTDTAARINRTLAARSGPILPLIAETGGLNAMFVDTTALREQVIDDVLQSAFGSAGQRCSALRILFLPDVQADAYIAGLSGAMRVLRIGDPADPGVDVGPVIDEDALSVLRSHRQRLVSEGRVLFECEAAPAEGLFFPPVLAEIPSADYLDREVFGPILHVVRYDPNRLGDAAAPLRAKGYGLTLGVHSRLERFIDDVREAVPAGNLYVNRSIIGAVVGVQPFGGEGLSGTGPKAGGPYSLIRYASEQSVSTNIAAQGGDPALLNL